MERRRAEGRLDTLLSSRSRWLLSLPFTLDRMGSHGVCQRDPVASRGLEGFFPCLPKECVG